MKKIYQLFNLTIIVSVLFLVGITSPVLAQTATPTSSDTTSAIKGIRDVVKEKVKEQLDVLKTDSKRGYTGKIIEISDSLIKIETNEGTIDIIIDEDTDIIGLNRSPIKAEDLKTNQYIISMGYSESENTLKGKRIVVIEKPSRFEKEVAVGKITDISKDNKLFTLKNEGKAKVSSLSIAKNISITQKTEKGEMEKLEISDLQKGDIVIAVGTPDKTDSKILNVYMIHLLSKSLGLPTPKTSASPASN